MVQSIYFHQQKITARATRTWSAEYQVEYIFETGLQQKNFFSLLNYYLQLVKYLSCLTSFILGTNFQIFCVEL